jgi:RNA polymerase sigma factor (sigma-70 family)
LSDENRELIVLCRFQELNYREIAKILNTTEGAVKVRMHRALNQLKSNYLKIENDW